MGSPPSPYLLQGEVCLDVHINDLVLRPTDENGDFLHGVKVLLFHLSPRKDDVFGFYPLFFTPDTGMILQVVQRVVWF